MTTYFLDTNFVLRFFLQDNLDQYNEAKKVLSTIDGRDTKANLTTEVVMEIEYLLRKFYKIPRSIISTRVLEFIESGLIETEKYVLIVKSLKKYVNINMDLVDILLFYQAKESGGIVLSFDKDFKKLS